MTIRIRELVIKADVSENEMSKKETDETKAQDGKESRVKKFLNNNTRQRRER
ncbi:MAG TPA: DUF5908 family protein [Paludibacteraceae bacterium]|mgnify:CR=1 FL=1|jgi:hypothetical protein|nr:DUF5908 family protein [Paludibacteraceae bacterium]